MKKFILLVFFLFVLFVLVAIRDTGTSVATSTPTPTHVVKVVLKDSARLFVGNAIFLIQKSEGVWRVGGSPVHTGSFHLLKDGSSLGGYQRVELIAYMVSQNRLEFYIRMRRDESISLR